MFIIGFMQKKIDQQLVAGVRFFAREIGISTEFFQWEFLA
jgi:hypothetical protein